MYLEFLLRRATRADEWTADTDPVSSLYSSLLLKLRDGVGVIGPNGSGLPSWGFPRRFAIGGILPRNFLE